MNNKYSRAYTEVLEIISHFSEDEYSKIPAEKINFYKENMDKNYVFKINPNIDLSKQNISEEANAVLITLFRDYFATEKQKETLKRILNQNEQKLEKEKMEKYNPDNIFNNRKLKENGDNIAENETQLVEYKETFFSRFTKFIKRILNIK